MAGERGSETDGGGGERRSAAAGSLSHHDCLALLASGGLGRIAVSVSALPMILPVQFWLDGDEVVFTFNAGDVVDRATRETVIAFQTDGHDGAGALWSVSLTGVARQRNDSDTMRTVAVATDHMTGLRTPTVPVRTSTDA
jgi:nitroimidazol reductase NimA-like FMN-containing flavoprotein (pyridoxamine 5'-phosphate oxidase superfamily)